MYYFAYGSNMSTARLAARVDHVEVKGVARLEHYQLFCDKHGGDGSGKFTIAEKHGNQVMGVIFQLQGSAREILDAFEGPGYISTEVSLQSAAGPRTAITYRALEEWRNEKLLPFDWYLAFTVAGAVEHGLPGSYIKKLGTWPSQPDPISERAALNRSILDGARPALNEQRQWPC